VRVAALYDVHANLPALDAVIADVHAAGVDHVVFGGDVLPGPMPRETVDRIQHLDIPTSFIHGNGDRETVAWRNGVESPVIPPSYHAAMRWVAQTLTDDDERWLASWPPRLRLAIPGCGDVLFCHASARNDTDIFTRLTDDDRVLSLFPAVDRALVVCGHSHMQFDRTIGRLRIVNAGSVGMPFGQPGAYWLVLGPGVELRRTDYDLQAAAARIRATAYPQAEEFAARNVVQPPTEAAMLEAFSRARTT
jgi:predicted phosphodiesterase